MNELTFGAFRDGNPEASVRGLLVLAAVKALAFGAKTRSGIGRLERGSSITCPCPPAIEAGMRINVIFTQATFGSHAPRACLAGVHLDGVRLAGVRLAGVRLAGAHVAGVCLAVVRLAGVLLADMCRLGACLAPPTIAKLDHVASCPNFEKTSSATPASCSCCSHCSLTGRWALPDGIHRRSNAKGSCNLPKECKSHSQIKNMPHVCVKHLSPPEQASVSARARASLS